MLIRYRDKGSDVNQIVGGYYRAGSFQAENKKRSLAQYQDSLVKEISDVYALGELNDDVQIVFVDAEDNAVWRKGEELSVHWSLIEREGDQILIVSAKPLQVLNNEGRLIQEV